MTEFPTGKYQPRCGADIVGNRESVKQLRTWLSGWLGSAHGRFALIFVVVDKLEFLYTGEAPARRLMQTQQQAQVTQEVIGAVEAVMMARNLMLRGLLPS